MLKYFAMGNCSWMSWRRRSGWRLHVKRHPPQIRWLKRWVKRVSSGAVSLFCLQPHVLVAWMASFLSFPLMYQHIGAPHISILNPHFNMCSRRHIRSCDAPSYSWSTTTSWSLLRRSKKSFPWGGCMSRAQSATNPDASTTSCSEYVSTIYPVEGCL